MNPGGPQLSDNSRTCRNNYEDALCQHYEKLNRDNERRQAKIRELEAEQAARRWRHEQMQIALDRELIRLLDEMRAILRGDFVEEDPATYN